MSALKFWLWLTELPGLTNQTRLALLRHFPTPEDVYYADPAEVLLTEGITREQAELLEDKDCAAAEKVLADCGELGLHIVTISDAAYPNRLRNIFDPPCLLYVRGRLPAFDDEAAVAVVGTRDCTPYGVSCAEKLGFGLAAGGALVVSGLARGIDSAALRGALRGGGTVTAVLGNGLDVVYPRRTGISTRTSRPPGLCSRSIRRARRRRGGTSRCATGSCPDCPWPPWWWRPRRGAAPSSPPARRWSRGGTCSRCQAPYDAPASVGCNRLIRDGAGLVTDAWDIWRPMRPASRRSSIGRARGRSPPSWAIRPGRGRSPKRSRRP